MTLMEEWLIVARKWVVAAAESKIAQNSSPLVSVNDVYAAICNGDLSAPPKAKNNRSGQAMCNVFLGVPYFSRTDKLEPGINPASKGRKVYIWLYEPAMDDRSVQFSRSKSFFNDLKKW